MWGCGLSSSDRSVSVPTRHAVYSGTVCQYLSPLPSSPFVIPVSSGNLCHELLQTSFFLPRVLAELFFDRGNFYDFTSLGEKPGRLPTSSLAVPCSCEDLNPAWLTIHVVRLSVRLLVASALSSAVRELDMPGEISEKKVYPFEFQNVDLQYESYSGVNVRLRYARHARLSNQACMSGLQLQFSIEYQAICHPVASRHLQAIRESLLEDCSCFARGASRLQPNQWSALHDL